MATAKAPPKPKKQKTQGTMARIFGTPPRKAGTLLEMLAETPMPPEARAADPLEAVERAAGQESWEALTKSQKEALRASRRRAEAFEYKVMGPLSERLAAAGADEAVLRSWLEVAPLTVNVNLQRDFEHFVGDDKYRNLFEVGRGGGGNDKLTRALWEQRMFGSAYGEAHRPGTWCAPEERPKYGGLNWANCSQGAAPWYGRSHFELRPHVRARVTLTWGDSCAQTHLGLATPDMVGMVLWELSGHSENLERLAAAAKGERSEAFTTYIEAQVHGDLVFARDVERLWASKTDAPDMEAVQKWAGAMGIEVRWMP